MVFYAISLNYSLPPPPSHTELTRDSASYSAGKTTEQFWIPIWNPPEFIRKLLFYDIFVRALDVWKTLIESYDCLIGDSPCPEELTV